jgi:hypothetical protein
MPTATERKKNEGDLAEEFLQHELMNETQAYVERGRRGKAGVMPLFVAITSKIEIARSAGGDAGKRAKVKK